MSTSPRFGPLSPFIFNFFLIIYQLGNTAHSTFGIPLQLKSGSVCAISVNSERAQLLRETSLIVWDEAPMAHRHAFEAVDRLLQDIMGNNKL